MLLLFVCTGNICRSPMAESVLLHLLRQRGVEGVQVGSAGLSAMSGCALHQLAAEALLEMQMQPTNGSAVQLDAELAARADRILCMTARQVRSVLRKFPGAAAKTSTLAAVVGSNLDIEDPYGGTLEDYRECLREMLPSLRALADSLTVTTRGKSPA